MSGTDLVLINKHTGRKYRVLSLDMENKTIVLQGDTASFTEVFDKEKFKKAGYTMKREN